MAHLDIDTALGWRGRTVRDTDGDKIGSLGDVFLDSETDLPAWAGVRTGLFGRRENYVPLDEVTEDEDGDLRVPFGGEVVKDAPQIDPDVALTREEEQSLYRHYGRDYGETGGAVAQSGAETDPAARTGTDVRTDPDARTAGRADTGAETDPGARTGAETDPAARTGARTDADARTGGGDDDAMTRSEEEVTVREGEMRPAERVRLRKVMVTEHQKRTVPVQREVVSLETEPREGDGMEHDDRTTRPTPGAGDATPPKDAPSDRDMAPQPETAQDPVERTGPDREHEREPGPGKS